VQFATLPNASLNWRTTGRWPSVGKHRPKHWLLYCVLWRIYDFNIKKLLFLCAVYSFSEVYRNGFMTSLSRGLAGWPVRVRSVKPCPHWRVNCGRSRL